MRFSMRKIIGCAVWLGTMALMLAKGWMTPMWIFAGITVLGLLPLLSAAFCEDNTEAEPFTFRDGVTWGMDRDKVISLEGKEYEEDEKDKLLIRPGITGYTQAYYRNGLGVREKRLYDAWYAHSVSFGLDVKIFFRTIKTVLTHENVYTNE